MSSSLCGEQAPGRGRRIRANRAPEKRYAKRAARRQWRILGEDAPTKRRYAGWYD